MDSYKNMKKEAKIVKYASANLLDNLARNSFEIMIDAKLKMKEKAHTNISVFCEISSMIIVLGE